MEGEPWQHQRPPVGPAGLRRPRRPAPRCPPRRTRDRPRARPSVRRRLARYVNTHREDVLSCSSRQQQLQPICNPTMHGNGWKCGVARAREEDKLPAKRINPWRSRTEPESPDLGSHSGGCPFVPAISHLTGPKRAKPDRTGRGWAATSRDRTRPVVTPDVRRASARAAVPRPAGVA